MDCSTPDFPVLHHLLEFAQTHVHWVSDVIQPSHPLLPPPPLSLNLSQHQGLFQWVSSSSQVTKVLELQYQFFQWIFRIDYLQDWLVWSPYSPRDSCLLQHHSSKALILQCSAFFMVELSYPYMTAGKTIALTRWTFGGKVMSLLFNMLSSHWSVAFFGHCFSSKEQTSFNFMAAVTICSDFGAQENKVCHCFHCFPHLFAMKWWYQIPWS